MSQCGHTNENTSGSTLSLLLNQDNQVYSPNFSNVTWDKEKVLNDLRLLPPAPPPLNWKKFAREHGITGGNAGQIAKEFAMASGVDTEQLDGK